MIKLFKGSNDSIFAEVVSLGIPYDNHATDLYIPVTDQTTRLLKKYGIKADKFKSNIDGKIWYDVPFAYDPEWENKR